MRVKIQALVTTISTKKTSGTIILLPSQGKDMEGLPPTPPENWETSLRYSSTRVLAQASINFL